MRLKRKNCNETHKIRQKIRQNRKTFTNTSAILPDPNKVSFMINYELPNIGTFDGLGGGDRHRVASQLSLLGEKIPSFLFVDSLSSLLIVHHEDSLSVFALCFSSV